MRAYLFALALAVPASAAQAADPPGDVILDARLRYEAVDQDGFAKSAQALTLRTRLGYETPAFHGFKALVEGENVVALRERYNSGTNGKPAYPVVSDPDTSQLNRAQVSWAGKDLDLVVGRQRLILNNARFVGNVGFRQNEQTFDAARAVWRPTTGVSVNYAYVDKVRRIFGDDHPQGEWRGDSHLMQVDAKTPIGQAAVYGYLLDFDNAPAQSSATWGARLAGSRPMSGGRAVLYEAEYAVQTDHGSAPAEFDLSYLALALGARQGASSVLVGLERLDGDGVRGFQTPLATLHAFQGWADVFLTTPATGLRDINVRAATSWDGPHGKPVRLQVAAHDFADADGSTGFGQEIDVALSTPINAHLSAELKAARFTGDRPAFADRTKMWMTLELKY